MYIYLFKECFFLVVLLNYDYFKNISLQSVCLSSKFSALVYLLIADIILKFLTNHVPKPIVEVSKPNMTIPPFEIVDKELKCS